MIKGILKLFFLVLLFQTSCMTKLYVAKEYEDWKKEAPASDAELKYQVHLIGDVGEPMNMEENLDEFASMIGQDTNSAVIFLGDNIYHRGLPPEGHIDRKLAEKKIDRVLETVDEYPGKVFFIPGNHDWDYMGKQGRERILLQEEYIETKLNRGNTFVPDHACPGPFKVSVSDELVLIFLDTQWWLHKHSKPEGDRNACNAIDAGDVIVQLKDILENNKGKHIVVAGHHPLHTNGNHGGYYNIMDHVFPLRLIQHRWFMYVPLPGLGSLYPLYRKFGGSEQDLPNYTYQKMRDELVKVFSEHKDIIYVAGHEHNLQYFGGKEYHSIVSGSGCKVTPLRKGGKAGFIQKNYGFCKIGFYSGGEAWLEFYAMNLKTKKVEVSFRTRLYRKAEFFPETYCKASNLDFSDSTVTVKASSQYNASKFKSFILGNHYRKSWNTPIKVDVLNLKTEKGGLIPYGIGGGKQSVSLKFKNIDNREYVARTVEKNPKLDRIINLDLNKTLAADIVQDQISAQHPYGAVTIPPMASAIGLLHTRPKITLIPQDSCLGPYYNRFSNTLVMLEEDPDESHEDAPNLGNAKNLVGSNKMFLELTEDNDNTLDQTALAKARFFDMFIGDWDRHERQFRWAEFEEGEKGKRFVPVPEDRDQVYFKFDGFFPSMLSKPWGARMLRDFGHKYRDIKGLNMAAANLDRNTMSELTREDWISIADSMKFLLTDEVIERAIRQFPPEIFAIDGEEIISKLKSRRDSLPYLANKYYGLLAEYVNVKGSRKHELFVVERLNNKTTQLTVYKIKSDGEIKKQLYQRTFNHKETKELRLYGMGGNDKFHITGKVRRGLIVRIIGGSEKDTVIDLSSGKSLRRKTILYDSKDGVSYENKKKIILHESDKPEVHDPGEDVFFYNYTGPTARFNYNQGDGLFLGLGLIHKRYKFRAKPYGSWQKLVLSYASATQSYRINYLGDFRSTLRKNDFLLYTDFYLPYFAMNYFGYGNKSSEKQNNIDYYRVQMRYGVVFPALVRRISSFMQVGVGPKLEYYDLVNRKNAYVSKENFSDKMFNPKYYLGLSAFFKMGEPDDKINPTRGLVFQGLASVNKSINHSRNLYTHFESDFRFYATPNLPFQLTLAGRVGAAVNTGDFEFYQANSLGGLTNLRGFYRTRFVGDRTFYQNLELRSQLLKMNAYILTGRLGVAAFIDNGIVWPGGGKYHQGYGAGLWCSFFDKAVVSTYYALSKEDRRITFNLGFFF
jgi:calcineurin-like phosphoesterase family protein